MPQRGSHPVSLPSLASPVITALPEDEFHEVVLGVFEHMRLARGGHGLPKVSPALAMPYPPRPFKQATPETALQLFQGWSARRVCVRLLPLWTSHAVCPCL
jgi:hypothetical protein